MAELLLELGLISKVASNIEIYKDRNHKEITNEPVRLIQALNTLKIWAQEPGKKLYIYDEVIESSPSRSAMSQLNVAWLRFIPQLSKTHTHLLVLTQVEQLVDSVFKNPVFCFGLWRKRKYRNKDGREIHVARFSSGKLQIEEYNLRGLPPTSIIFNPNKIATFNIEESSTDFNLMPRTLKVAYLYSKKPKQQDIERTLDLNREEIRRELCKIYKILVTMSHTSSEGKRVLQICDELEKTMVH